MCNYFDYVLFLFSVQCASVISVKALWSRDAQNEYEISFEAGDAIDVRKVGQSSMWIGLRSGKVGLVPSNYLEPLQGNFRAIIAT